LRRHQEYKRKWLRKEERKEKRMTDAFIVLAQPPKLIARLRKTVWLERRTGAKENS
jgi:hypothetical protein